MSEIFQKVKHAVTAKQAAERYGLKVNRYGMARCPFHDDRTPSMKVGEKYYCFACCAKGDSIDLTAGILGLNLKEAAEQLAKDFGISYDVPKVKTSKKPEDPHCHRKKKSTNRQKIGFIAYTAITIICSDGGRRNSRQNQFMGITIHVLWRRVRNAV